MWNFFETFPKHNGYCCISEFFYFEWICIYAINKQKLKLPISGRRKHNFLLNLVKLVEYLASAVAVVSDNFSGGPWISILTYIFSYYQYAMMNYCLLQKY